MHMRPGPIEIERWVIKCPDCQWGWIEDQMCRTCDGLGRIILPEPRQRPFVSRRLSNLTIAITLIALALLLSWWVVR